MDIFTLLNKHEQVLIDDSCEDRKTRKSINTINHYIADIVDMANEFKGFTESQLEGSYHHKLVMAKSLLYRYNNWTPMVKAYEKIEKEEKTKVDKFYVLKEKLLTEMRALLKDSLKNPVVCQYDVFNDDFRRRPENHNMIILGDNNNEILKSMIRLLDIGLQIKGRFEEVETKDLLVNYANVMTNVNRCNEKLEEMYSNDPAKYNKLKDSIAKMEEIGKVVVLFTTYRDDLAMVGVGVKDLDAYEKAMTKEYIPFKKQLKKAFHIEFEEICDLVVNEDLFKTAGEDGYEPNLTTYNASDVTFVTPEPEPQYEPVYEEPQTNEPEEVENTTDNQHTEEVEESQETTTEETPHYVDDGSFKEELNEKIDEAIANNRPQSRFGKVFDELNENNEDDEIEE